jgi:hypothetical protein
MRTGRFACSLLLASAAAIGMASSAYSFTLTDDPNVTGTLTQNIYFGATGYPGYGDVIGLSPPFGILDAVISRTGSVLTIRIDTNFAGAPGTPAADGTVYGSLFLTPVTPNPAGNWGATGSGNYLTDNWVNGNQNWAYAVTTPTGTGSGPQMTGLYAIGSVTGVVDQASTSVPKYYTTANGRVYMSYTANSGGNGDPLQANATPVSGSNGWGWRQGQAVQYIPNNALAFQGGTSVVETISTGNSITYTITDNGLLGNTFGLAWDMTCANDAIQGYVNLTTDTGLTATPLPAALPMFTAGLGMMGLLGWRRKRKSAAALAAA